MYTREEKEEFIKKWEKKVKMYWDKQDIQNAVSCQILADRLREQLSEDGLNMEEIADFTVGFIKNRKRR